MDLVSLIQQRVSCPVVEEPGPSASQLDAMFRAALRAPDHGNLKPWRFLVVEGEARAKLGELFLQAALAKDPALVPPLQEKMRNMPLRAPTLVVVIARLQQHPKVPLVEQQVAAGAAAQNILLAAHGLGLGAMWRTGDMAYNPDVMRGLGLAENEEIIGFVYLGSRPAKTRNAPALDPADFVEQWRG
ncbi:nitroreductase family protein [Motiliproteus sediminis]|uniref:nitroreductase family protein n=1 Tax=Motiliproteus sediminis TaxID=1468178 RepID=UPI001AF00ACD|nr:nitroreductase [Motiliproteus sediminis]